MLSRIGVLLCTCAHKLESVDFDKVLSYLTGCYGVQTVQVHRELCKQPSLIRNLVRSEKLEGLVVGACSFHETLFRDESEDGGLNPLLLEVLNLKEQLAGPHVDREKATLKAALIVRAAVEKMKRMEAVKHVPPQRISANKQVTRRALFRSVLRFLMVYKPTPLVEGSLCINPKACKLCINACSYGALTLGEGGIVVEREKCKVCGSCAASCPFGAIQIPTHNDEQLEVQMRWMLSDMGAKLDRRVIVFACEESGYPAINAASEVGAKVPLEALIIRVPSLGVLSELTLLTAFALGADGVLLAGCPDNDCPHLNGLLSAKQKLSTVKSLLSSFNIDTSRIGIFQARKDESSKLADNLTKFVEDVKHMSPNTLRLTFSGNNRRAKLISLIKALAEETGKVPGILEWAGQCPFADVLIDQERCTACELCGSLCPTKAIEVHKDEKSVALSFKYRDCIGCGLCESTCPEKAVSLKRVFDVGRLLESLPKTLAVQGLVACSNCKKPFTTINKLKKIREIQRQIGVTPEPSTLVLCPACKRNHVLPVMYPTKEVRR
ncbi:MAG: hypothetical protein B9J98_06720 [Candidatus Terraquivivens tikiterensis]|uniref:4Fe-4S ferredoxin-type domain-containing protein n=1 Tax=Candidatus Terraquivivens tikiterensis TaxID=1980982 RepID=A0A2R7Y1E1_9ARCH|nr:MAG: hypothetical protein B9J98_06720 [Candidatus Terraquivivens tikiterensis]